MIDPTMEKILLDLKKLYEMSKKRKDKENMEFFKELHNGHIDLVGGEDKSGFKKI